MAAQSLLKSGTRKNIGSGTITKVWKDHWIPTIPAREAIRKSSSVYEDPNMTVNQLINQDTKTWKIQTLQRLFTRADVDKILSMKIGNNSRPDGYIWNYTKSGLYRVKSGYEHSRKICLEGSNFQVSEPSYTKLKEFAWELKAPRKLKHFIWQALSGCIATCQRLSTRHIRNTGMCPRCGDNEETINHLLFECPPALQVWALSNIPSSPGIFPRSSLFYNFDYLFWRFKDLGVSNSKVGIYPWIIWYIWKAKNDKTFNGKETPPYTTLQIARSEALAWEKSKEEESSIKKTFSEESPTINGLQENMEEYIAVCQTDASWIEEDEFIGLGWFYKNKEAYRLFGLKGTSRNLSPLHAEVDGLLWAMESLIEKHFLEVRMETDCANILKMIEEPLNWQTFSGELDLFQTLRNKFITFHICYIPRTKNIIADHLAKEARKKKISFSYVNFLLPNWLSAKDHRLEAILC